jgi:hypothetical protein
VQRGDVQRGDVQRGDVDEQDDLHGPTSRSLFFRTLCFSLLFVFMIPRATIIVQLPPQIRYAPFYSTHFRQHATPFLAAPLPNPPLCQLAQEASKLQARALLAAESAEDTYRVQETYSHRSTYTTSRSRMYSSFFS